MKEIPDDSIDLTVTSPPYDNLRSYNGNNDQWDEHVWKAVLKDLYRVTKSGGVVVWVVGDATIKGSETGTSFKQALWAMECGFNLHDTMIYKKTGGGARGSNLCYWQNFEYMFVFSKGRPKSINLICDKKNIKAGSNDSGVNGRAKDGSKRYKKVGKVAAFGRRENVWVICAGNNTADDKTDHPAVFPESLARDHIISWSNEGDIIFDPFMGSGTTGKMANLTGRNFIGIELDENYFKIAQERIGAT
jgi:site-specific DNA-methyltransferase (adenine-specific)